MLLQLALDALVLRIALEALCGRDIGLAKLWLIAAATMLLATGIRWGAAIGDPWLAITAASIALTVAIAWLGRIPWFAASIAAIAATAVHILVTAEMAWIAN